MPQNRVMQSLTSVYVLERDSKCVYEYDLVRKQVF